MDVHLTLKFEEDASYEDMKKMDEMVNGWLDQLKEIVDVLINKVEEVEEAQEIKTSIPADKLAAAEMRLAQLDALEEKCNWGNPCSSAEERKARESWQRIMDAQSEFECKYC